MTIGYEMRDISAHFFFFQCYLLQKQAFMDQAQTSLCETGFQMDQKQGEQLTKKSLTNTFSGFLR